MDDEWDRARADRSVGEIARLELELLEHVKAAMREAKAFARDFVAVDKRLIRKIQRLIGYLDTFGIWPVTDLDEISVENLLAPWEDAVAAAEQITDAADARELLRQIETTDCEFAEEQEELRRLEKEE